MLLLRLVVSDPFFTFIRMQPCHQLGSQLSTSDFPCRFRCLTVTFFIKIDDASFRCEPSITTSVYAYPMVAILVPNLEGCILPLKCNIIIIHLIDHHLPVLKYYYSHGSSHCWVVPHTRASYMHSLFCSRCRVLLGCPNLTLHTP